MAQESVVRSELLDLFGQADAIEKKYADGLITDEGDQHKMAELLGQIKTKELELSALDDARARHEQIVGGLTKYQTQSGGVPPLPPAGGRRQRKSLGDMFVDSEDYKEAHEKGLFDSKRHVPEFGFTLEGVSLLERKEDLLYTGSGDPGMGIDVQEPFESRWRVPGILPLLYWPNTFLTLVRRVPTDEEMIEYVLESSFTSGAASVAEAEAITGTTGKKPSSTMAFTVEHTTVIDVAHWMAVTNKMLRNKAAIRGLINERLVLGLDQELESQICNGAGAGDLTGILNTTGIQTQGLGTDSSFDAIHKAITLIRVNAVANPNGIVMHPNDWEAIRLFRIDEGGGSGTGNYLFGGPQVPGSPTLWGLPVTQTTTISEGTVLVGDFNQVTLFDRMRTTIRTGLVDDQFIRNMQTILAECAVALVVWRPAAFCQVTGV